MFVKNYKLISVQIPLALILISAAFAATPGVSWNTFWGGIGADGAGGIAVDGSGNAYVLGYSQSTWGAPLNAHAGGYDATIVKIDSDGIRGWHTFLGGTAWDFGEDIILDSNGNIYVTGVSQGSWGTPVRAFGGWADAFVAKFDSNGALQWNTFLGGEAYDYGYSIGLDDDGNVYVTGYSNDWGAPLNPHGGAAEDAFVAKLNGNGDLQWHTFLGGDDLDDGFAIHVTPSGDIFIAGESDSNWGAPINAHSGTSSDAFVAKLNSNGALQWHTFMGGTSEDRSSGISVDANENVYVAGFSWTSWGAPINSFGGGLADAFVAKLNSSGVLQWNTFLGGTEDDTGRNIAIDDGGDILVTGDSGSTWGTPINPFAGYYDAFVVKLNANGIRLRNTFLGGTSDDVGRDIAVKNGLVYVTGYSAFNWGSPIVPHIDEYEYDTFVAKLVFNPSTSSTIKSTATSDGWVLESSETSGVGGTKDNAASTIQLGDDPANKQYRAILSFDTSTLPAGAVITSVTLKFKHAGVVGTLPFGATHGNLLVDICKGVFSGLAALQRNDFNIACSKNTALAYTDVTVNNWYSKSFKSVNFQFINPTGKTQFRLRFGKDDNNDLGADFLKIFSGNAVEANRPQLIIEYYVQ